MKHFNFEVDKTSSITIAYYVLHNYCEMWGAPEFRLTNARIRGDNLMGFGVNKLPIVRKRDQAKVEGEKLRIMFFEQWVINHPIVP